jgi:hypothetical protein
VYVLVRFGRAAQTLVILGNDSKAFDAFFASVMENPPSLTERENSSHCPR